MVIMYCPKCHKAMDPELPNCKYCGFLNKEYDYSKDRTIKVDYKNPIFNILSLFIPVVGLILYFSNKNSNPNMSKSIIHYTIGGIVIYLIMYLLFFVVIK